MANADFTCDVAVIGAGLAGMAAADALAKKGLNVQVFERESRVGGRVWTRHLPDGSHFELGAFSFADSEKTLWRLVNQHGLDAMPHSVIDREFVFENRKGRFSDRASSLIEGAPSLTFGDLLPSCLEKISEQEDVSFEQALLQAGVPEKVVRWLENHTLPGLLGEGFASLSLQGARQYFDQYVGSKKFYAVKGGNDQIPMALAKELGERIHCQFPIAKIESCAQGWQLHGEKGSVTAAQVIFAVPIPALQQIDPPLSLAKKHAMKQIRYTSCTRMSVTAPLGHLGETRGGVFGIARGWLRDQTLFQKTPLTVFNHSFVGRESKQIKQMEEPDRKKHVLENLRRFMPEFHDDTAEFFFHSWDDVEWIRGGYAYFPPQSFQFKAELASSENSLYFCGEHTSDKPASMNGALQSGMRAAFEVLATRNRDVIARREIIPIHSILEIEAYFFKTGRSLVAFDIDDTLTRLRDPAFQRPSFTEHYQAVFEQIKSSFGSEDIKTLAYTLPLLKTPSDLIEPETPELFQRLKTRANTKAVAITLAMGGEIEETTVEDRRIAELQRVGIDFSSYFPEITSVIDFPNFKNLKLGRAPVFKDGVILTNEQDKGEVMVQFIAHWLPDFLYIVDDRKEHLRNVMKAMQAHYPHITVIALHYQADDKTYQTPDVEYFKRRWMEMGEEAKRIHAKMSGST